VQKGANSRVVYALLAFLLVGGLAMIGGAAWSYADEHSGRAAEAKITHCTQSGAGKYSGVHCDGTWSVDGHTTTGAVFNAKWNDYGKTRSVRVHGGRATIPTLWVSIGLLIMGLFVTAVGVWILVLWRRRQRQPT
jgi:hypothetical protein